jgi:predicted  nucleic acid-binding Zn-ribbon protein
MKLIKTVAIASVLLTTVGFFLFQGDFPSIFSTAIGSVQREARVSLPLDFEIDRVRDTLESARADVQAQTMRVAELKGTVESLATEIGSAESEIAHGRTRVRNLRDAFEATGNGARLAVYRGVRVEPEAVTGKLQTAVGALENRMRILQSKQRIHDTQQKALKQAMATLNALQQRCDEVENGIEIAKMDSEVLRYSRQAVGLEISSSSLADAESQLKAVRHRVRVNQIHSELLTDPLNKLEEAEIHDPALLGQRVEAVLGETDSLASFSR